MDVPDAAPELGRVEEFRRRHYTALVTLVFTDLVNSVALRRELGDQAATTLLQTHRLLVRELLQRCSEAEEIETAGDSFLLVFSRPSDAVRFALHLEAQVRRLAQERKVALADRIGIHVGEVVVQEHAEGRKPKDLYGSQMDLCARLMSLAEAGQILLTRAVFDSARQSLKGEELDGLHELHWLDHGLYLLKGIEEPVEICEVGEDGLGVLRPPTGSEKAQRQVRAGEEAVLGWRPALGQVVPNTRWILEKKLGEGGFGEVWLGRHQTMKERRVFKFCFRADRVRFLKREMTLFRLIKERIGDHPNIVALREVFFDAPPFYVEMDYIPGEDLRKWSEARGGVAKVPVLTRLEIVAQIADGLQAAHDAGVIHRDIKPTNILIGKGLPTRELSTGGSANTWVEVQSLQASAEPVQAKLTDFGIGQILSEEYLAGVTRAGFTETILADSAASGTGTQLYMAPELLAGQPASIRSDIYALGVVLYQLLSADLTRPLTTDWAASIDDPLLRTDLAHCFAGNPRERFASAAELAKNIRTLAERRAVLAERQRVDAAARRRRTLTTFSAALAALCLLIALALGYGLRQARHEALEARRNLYVAHVNLVQHALQAENLGRATEILRTDLPRQGQEDLRGFEWWYLWQLCRSDELFPLPQHSSQITGVSFTPNGKLLASACMDGTVKIWGIESRTKFAEFGAVPEADTGWDNSVHFLPDSKTLVTGIGRRVRWTDVTRAGDWHVLPGAAGHVSLSLRANLLATGSTNGVKLWNTTTWDCVGALPVASEDFDISPDGTLLAARTSEAVVLWNVAERRPIKSLNVPRPLLFSFVTFSPDGYTLAIHSADNTIALWNLQQDQSPVLLRGHRNLLVSAAFSPDGRTLASFSLDHNIKLWDVSSGTHTHTLQGHQNEVWVGMFSPDGRLLATGGKDFALKLWDPRAPPKEPSKMTEMTPLWVSPDSQTMLVCSTNRQLKHVHAQDLRQITTWALDENARLDVNGISSDGRLVAVSMPGNLIDVRDSATGQRLAQVQGSSSGVAFSRSGRLLVTSGPDATAKVWELPSGNLKASFRQATAPFAIAPDERILAASGARSQPGQGFGQHSSLVRLWDLSTQRELGSGQTAHFNEIAQMVFSPTGQFLATASIDNTVKLWQVPSGRHIATLAGHKSGVLSISISPDGRTLASASDDATVQLWNLATYQEVLTLPGRTVAWGAAWVQFSGDGKTLLFGSAENSGIVNAREILGRMWQTPTRTEIARAEATNPPK